MDTIMLFRTVVIVGLCLSALGCAGRGEHEDLQAFMVEAKNQPVGEIEPLPTFDPYATFKYSAVAFRSPFDKPLTAISKAQPSGKTAIKPNDHRKKEFLESFNFSSFTLTGSIEKNGTIWSLINDGEGDVHRVALGNYLGKNHGRIVAISESKIDVVEIVPDGKGGWVERPRTLGLREND